MAGRWHDHTRGRAMRTTAPFYDNDVWETSWRRNLLTPSIVHKNVLLEEEGVANEAKRPRKTMITPSDILKAARATESRTLVKFEERVQSLARWSLPILDASVTWKGDVVDETTNAEFVSTVERELYRLIVKEGYSFERKTTGNISLFVPARAWIVATPALVTLKAQKDGCDAMFAVCVDLLSKKPWK
jgi:hypothetical protein